MLDFVLDFWKRHPALLIGLLSLLGTACALACHPIYMGVLICLLFPFVRKRCFTLPFFLAIGACVFTFTTASFRITPTQLPQDKIEGKGLFHIENLSILASPFNRSYCYKGTLKCFESKDGKLYSNLPCSVFHPLKHPPKADKDYTIEGALTQKKENLFCLKPKKNTQWKSIAGTYSFAQLRFDAKKKVASYVKQHISNSASASFLSALITGDVDERSLRLDFGRLGLQHLLAISGFHFSFFALVLNILLRPFFPFTQRNLALMASLAAYFCFLGNAPSILRAFTVICIYLVAQLIKRRTSGLNALGAALTLELLLDPYVVTQLSFQLSFLCTLALLLFYPLVHHFVCYLLPERTSSELHQMPLLDQHGYILSALIRKSLSVNVAVCLFSIPVLLHIFHKFPLLSLVYNLFFPFCVSLSLLLLCCALILSMLVPPLSSLLHTLNSTWTTFLLQLTSNPPSYFDVVLRTNAISFPIVIGGLLMLFFIGVYFSSWKRSMIFAEGR